MKFSVMLILLALLVSGCLQNPSDPAAKEVPAATNVAPEAAPPVIKPFPKNPRVALEEAVVTCKADPECMSSLVADNAMLTSCPWYEAIGCSVAVAAAAAGCVITEGEACLECLEAVKAIGCCDCLPTDTLKTMCKALPVAGSTATPEAAPIPVPVPMSP